MHIQYYWLHIIWSVHDHDDVEHRHPVEGIDRALQEVHNQLNQMRREMEEMKRALREVMKDRGRN